MEIKEHDYANDDDDDDDFEVIDSQYELIKSTRVEESQLRGGHQAHRERSRPQHHGEPVLPAGGQEDGRTPLHGRTQVLGLRTHLRHPVTEGKGLHIPGLPRKRDIRVHEVEGVDQQGRVLHLAETQDHRQQPLFDPDFCPELKEFLSQGKEFEARKQIEKSNKGIFNLSWHKLKTYLVFSKQNKYADAQSRVVTLRTALESLYARCRMLIDCLREQQFENHKLLSHSFQSQKLRDYMEMMEKLDQDQSGNLKELQELQFLLFYENEDLQMVNKVFGRISEMKVDEDNYGELKCIEQKLEQRLEQFIASKEKTRKSNELKLKWMIDDIKQSRQNHLLIDPQICY